MRYMNPIKEAKDLISLFEYEDNLGIAENTGIEGIDKEKAKECALITINEILAICPLPNRDYYEEVKQEIGKL